MTKEIEPYSDAWYASTDRPGFKTLRIEVDVPTLGQSMTNEWHAQTPEESRFQYENWPTDPPPADSPHARIKADLVFQGYHPYVAHAMADAAIGVLCNID